MTRKWEWVLNFMITEIDIEDTFKVKVLMDKALTFGPQVNAIKEGGSTGKDKVMEFGKEPKENNIMEIG